MSWTDSDGLRAVKHMQIRTSCRSFLDKEIPENILDEIFTAALQAPSGGNLQPVTVINITDHSKRSKMMEICGGQKFIGEAPVNLVFFLDWHKMGIFAKNEKAPFTCTESFNHFVIGLEDVICMAQIIESAAHLCGLGSCYVGTTNSYGDEISEFLNMPKHVYPVVMLSLGYPKLSLKPREKLAKEMMIFSNEYPSEVNDEYIVNEFRKKYQDKSMPLPKDEVLKNELIEDLKLSLATSYSDEEVLSIIDTAIRDNKINETQRRFGLHYHAAKMRENGIEVMSRMEKMKLTPFNKK